MSVQVGYLPRITWLIEAKTSITGDTEQQAMQAQLKKALRETQTLRARWLKIMKLGHVTQSRPLMGRFVVPTQGGSVLYVCTKFEADRSFRSKVIMGSQISQTPFPVAQDRQNLISWIGSLPAPIDPVWWRSMHAISSYCGNRHRPPATNTDRTDYNTLRRSYS